MKKKYRIAVVNSHPIQYFAPLYAYLNSTEELEVTALYCSDFSLRGGVDPGFKQAITWDVDLTSGYRSVFLGKQARSRSPAGFWSLVCPELYREIRRGGYDVVLVHGNQFAAYVLAVLVAKMSGLPVFNRHETILGLSRTPWRRYARDRVLKVFYKFFDGFLAIGSENREYYKALGVSGDRIFDVPYTVDNARFIAASNIGVEERAALRQRYGLPADGPVVLYASKLIRRKHPDDLLRAAAILAREGLKFHVLMVGTGEMESELKALATDLGLDNVAFAGFVNQAELPKIYSATDVFVLASEDEPWGLIVNEVMCAGRPVVVAHGVGCVPDLVKDGVNGRLVRPRDPLGLAAALRELILDEDLRHRMGAASLKLISDWDYEACRRGIVAAVRRVYS